MLPVPVSKVILYTQFKAGFGIGKIVIAAQDDDMDVGKMFFDLGGETDSVHSGHDNVGNDDIRPQLLSS